jgi:hypothetical protein
MSNVASVCNLINGVLFSIKGVNLTTIEAPTMLIHLDNGLKLLDYV